LLYTISGPYIKCPLHPRIRIPTILFLTVVELGMRLG
jgi:hypothetical protein